MKNIIVVSSSRADRGLLEPIAEKLGDECEFIHKEPPISWECCRSALNNNDAGKKVILLGDRWETLLLAFRAIELNCIIYHIHGGEETLGSKDNIYRGAITRLSHVHLTSHQQFADRIIRMGESKENIFVTGSLGVWRAKKIFEKQKRRNSYLKDMGVSFKVVKYLTVILHPNTIEPEKTESEIITLLNGLKPFVNDFRVDFYAPNYDNGREIIERKIKAFCELNSNTSYLESLDGDEFLMRLQHSACIIGNSSCGIIEAPTLRVPTINVGERQNGRPRAKSVINTDFNTNNIITAIKKAITEASKLDYINPYDNVEHDTVDMICDIIRNHPVQFQKRFVD